MVMDCIFCKIIAGEIPADIIFQNEELIAFRDIKPIAPVHILIVPKSHIVSIVELDPKHEGLMGRLILQAKSIAEKENISSRGYRLVINCGAEGGQLVPHLHLHLLGGRQLNNQLG